MNRSPIFLRSNEPHKVGNVEDTPHNVGELVVSEDSVIECDVPPRLGLEIKNVEFKIEKIQKLIESEVVDTCTLTILSFWSEQLESCLKSLTGCHENRLSCLLEGLIDSTNKVKLCMPK